MTGPVTTTFETTQTDDAAEAIRQGFGFRAALSAGQLSYRQHLIRGDVVTMSDLRVGAQARMMLDPSDVVMLVNVHSGVYQYDPWGRRHTIGPSGTFVLPPEQSLRFEIDHTDASTTSFSRAALRSVGQEVYGLDDVVLTEGAVRPRDAGRSWLWARTVDAYRQHVLETPSAYASQLVRAQATRFLIVSAITAFGLIEHQQPDERAQTSAAVRRAMTFMDERVQSALTVQDVASAAGLSPRGLALAFRRERDQSPMEYLREARLAGAHRDLLDGDPARGDTVAAIAAAWGFANAGRFAGLYRERHGVAPSQTLSH